MSDSRFLQHESCPSCGSKDNLARYSDGGAWCFGCKYRERGNTSLRSRIQSFQLPENRAGSLALPYDSSTELPTEALQWLYKYELTEQEIKEHGFIWSGSNGGIVMPCTTDSNSLVGYQIRRISTEHRQRYEIRGNKLQMSINSLKRTAGSHLIFVEDLLSAIKVARFTPCIPLYGSILPPELLEWSLKRFNRFSLWLDPDKRKECVKQCLNYSQKGYDIKPIFSNVDPKECSDVYINWISK